MQVHEIVTSPLVDYVVDGYNATVFAYGPTGKLKKFVNYKQNYTYRIW